MSLTDLPVELIASISTYLDYSDVCNVMETSTKNHNAIKAYGKERIKLTTLRISNKDGLLTIRSEEMRNKRYKFKDSNNCEGKSVETIEKALDTCFSVFAMYLTQVNLSDMAKVLEKTKPNIRHITVYPEDMSIRVEEILELCQISKKVTFRPDGQHFDPKIWNDDVLTKLLPASTIDISGRRYYNTTCRPITDRTLFALIGENTVQNQFSITGVYNSITIDGILKAIQTIEARKIRNSSWDFGVLSSEQAEDAERYFGSEYEEIGEMTDIYDITREEEIDEYAQYIPRIHYQIEGRDVWFSIKFAIGYG